LRWTFLQRADYCRAGYLSPAAKMLLALLTTS
jgi:hypothetical protein